MFQNFTFWSLIFCVSFHLGWGDVCGSGVDKCDPKSRERAINGSCNNLKQPKWGSAQSTLNRLLPAQYADGKKLKR